MKRVEVEVVQIGHDGPEKCHSDNFSHMELLNDWLAGRWLMGCKGENTITATEWAK